MKGIGRGRGRGRQKTRRTREHEKGVRRRKNKEDRMDWMEKEGYEGIQKERTAQIKR